MKILNLGNIIANNYIIETPRGYLIIDTGYPGGYSRFRRKLINAGIALDDIRVIFVTHAHDDHVGFLGDLLADTDVPVIMHEETPERLLLGHNKNRGGCPGLAARFFVGAMALTGSGGHEFPAVSAGDRALLWDGKTQHLREMGIPFTILSLPGHTGDSIGFITPDGRLFCGDAAMNGVPSVKRKIIWIEDPDAYRDSWDKMTGSGAVTIYPGHGAPFPMKDLIKYRGSLDAITIYKTKQPQE
ncbi:MBL fold metallo-hydrolase [Breznakiella homolactica]|uniref:MBL fold metallo-hydrolase n=1 Tax=Breznakiella homolactica TaxID=2798577 RepID=A0A7T7XPG5_9SPIR|nr:MBL fold metallo-hydrolase [Breznakiella homolactica]QQO10124.1 MBL fold metallo-hydrolase [Breznakiella homolactica]